MFHMKMSTKGSAFTEEFAGKNEEVARILEEAAMKLREGNERGIMLDMNGNLVGEWRLTNR